MWKNSKNFSNDTYPHIRKSLLYTIKGTQSKGSDPFYRHRDSQKPPIDMLILDVMMPRKNGKQVYAEIKAENPDVKALFLSGYTSDILSERGIVAEDVNLLTKPVSADELLKKIREVLDK